MAERWDSIAGSPPVPPHSPALLTLSGTGQGVGGLFQPAHGAGGLGGAQTRGACSNWLPSHTRWAALYGHFRSRQSPDHARWTPCAGDGCPWRPAGAATGPAATSRCCSGVRRAAADTAAAAMCPDNSRPAAWAAASGECAACVAVGVCARVAQTCDRPAGRAQARALAATVVRRRADSPPLCLPCLAQHLLPGQGAARPQHPEQQQQAGRRRSAAFSVVCIHADYAAKATDGAVLQRPLKVELMPSEIKDVFGFPRNLKEKCVALACCAERLLGQGRGRGASTVVEGLPAAAHRLALRTAQKACCQHGA